MMYDYPHPVSRTYQYKKITKPLLERKRRARINRCLDELKDLMVDALETEGENISKLEKADILELTVRHLQRLQSSRPSGLSTSAAPGEDSCAESRWRSGFGHCAAEACRFLAALPGEAAEKLARHLAEGLHTTKQLNVQVSPKHESVSPILADLDKTANILTSPADSSGKIGASSISVRNTPPRIVHVYSGSPGLFSPAKSIVTSGQADSSQPRPVVLQGEECDLLEKDRTEVEEKCPRKMRTDFSQMVAEEDEEIDVERVDGSDPMWRPW